MNYVESNLLAGENVLYTGKIHWFVYASGVLATLFSFAFISDPATQAAGQVFMALGLALLLGAFIQRRTTELAITNKRVISKIGLIRRSTIELNHTKVEGFSIEQGIFGRIFDFGTVIIQGTGGGRAVIKNIDGPMAFKKKSMEIIDTSQSKDRNT